MPFYHHLATARDYVRSLDLRFLPLRSELKDYAAHHRFADFHAGLDVALHAFPQGLALAAVAGLPLHFGVLSTAAAAFGGALFAGSRFVMQGPSNATALLLFSSFLALGVSEADKALMAPLLVFMVGCILIVGALCNVASFLQFISRSVVAGYITAGSLYIIFNQLPRVLDVSITLPPGASLLTIARLTLANLGSVHPVSVGVAVFTGAVYVVLRQRFPKGPYILLALLAGTFASFALNYSQLATVSTLEAVQPGHLLVPAVEFRSDWISRLSGSAFVIAFLCLLESSSIAKSFAASSGSRLNVNQETLSLGTANLASAFFGGMPSSGSLTRSQLADERGAHTALASVWCGVFCLVAIIGLGPFLALIPKSGLAILVILVGLGLIQKSTLQIIYRSTRDDALVLALTFGTALLLRLDVAIIVGVMTSVFLFLRKAATPDVIQLSFDQSGDLREVGDKDTQTDPEVSIVHVEGDLFFGAADLFQSQLRRVAENPRLQVLILKVRNARNLDASAMLALHELLGVMRRKGRHLLVTEVREPQMAIFLRSGFAQALGPDNLFPDEASNPTLSTAKALRRALKITGFDAKVSVFAPAEKKPVEEPAFVPDYDI